MLFVTPLVIDDEMLTLIHNPSNHAMNRCHSLTHDPDDAHILAGAIESGCQYLISTEQVIKHLSPIIVCSPKSFWQSL